MTRRPLAEKYPLFKQQVHIDITEKNVHENIREPFDQYKGFQL